MIRSNIGKTIGAMLLIAGSCIGAGMLAIPVVTGLAGFVPSIIIFVIGWAFMTTTGLLLLEVNLWLGKQVSIVSMAGRTMGNFGRIASWILFCFLFYLLLVAYIAGSGSLVVDFFEGVFGSNVQRWVGSLLFTVIFGFVVYLGTRTVDLVNRLLMVGLIVTYVLLVALGARHVDAELLTHSQFWPYAIVALPVIVISFGFHNMIPSMTRYLDENRTGLRICVIVGSLIPLVVYLLWEWIILGIVPAVGDESFVATLQEGDLATHALKKVLGATWAGTVAQYFAFFAVVTSFVAQALSLIHFIADGLAVTGQRKYKELLCLLAIVPPFVLAMIDPTIFIRAIEIAGAYSAVVLFGVFPAIMVWIGRYRAQEVKYRMMFGGKATLVIVVLFSLFVIVVEILNQAGALKGSL